MKRKEFLQNTELPPKGVLFEQLFPGNKYFALPIVNGRDAIKAVLGLQFNSSNNRAIKFFNAQDEKRSLAFREVCNRPNRLTVHHSLAHTTFLENSSHPTKYGNQSFSDLIDIGKGEKLGGIATHKIVYPHFTRIYKLAELSGEDIYVDIDVKVAGILDKDNRPCALLYFMKDVNPRKRKN